MAIAVIALAGYFYATRAPRVAVTPQTLSIARLTDNGHVHDAAISPDGKWLALMRHDAHAAAIWVKQVATGSETRVVAPQEGSFTDLAFSPDGNYLYYAFRPAGKAQQAVYVVPSLGGTPRLVINNTATGVAFSPDGRQVAFMREVGGRDRVVVADANDNGEKTVTENPHLYKTPPSWSADGKTLLLTTDLFTEKGLGALLLQPVAGGEARQVAARGQVPAAQWLQDGMVWLEKSPETQGRSQIYFRADPSSPAGAPDQRPERLRRCAQRDRGRQGNRGGADGGVNRDLRRRYRPVSPASTSSPPVTGMSSERDVTDWTPDGKIVVQDASGHRRW